MNVKLLVANDVYTLEYLMNRKDIIVLIAEHMMGAPYGNALYDDIAYGVGEFAIDHNRLANADDIKAIASDNLAIAASPSDTMYRHDYDSLPRFAKVDVDGEPHVIINGNAIKVSFVEDGRPQNIATSMIAEMRLAYNGMSKSGTTFDELFEIDNVHCCPECGSCDCTMFYGEDDGDAWHCNECDADFFVGDGVLVDTVEEVELIPEHDVIMAFDYDDIMKSFRFTIFDGDEPIYDGVAGTHDAMQAYCNGFIQAYDMMRPGIGIANVKSGKRFDVDEVNGNAVVCGNKTASRVKMAASIAGGTMMVVSDQIYANDVVAGDVWSSTTHDVEVDIVDNDSVYWYENERAGNAVSSHDYYTDTIQGFLTHMDVDGFSQI